MAMDYDIKSGQVVLYIVPAKDYVSTNISILKKAVNSEKNFCIYMTVNKPYTTLINLLKSEKIDTEKIFFIDAVTPVTGTMRAENVVFVGSPQALTNISMSVSSAIKSLPKGNRLLFFDSVSTLSIYNDAGSVIKFSHFIINKIREWELAGVVICLEKETDEKMLSQLSQFCDKVVEVK